MVREGQRKNGMILTSVILIYTQCQCGPCKRKIFHIHKIEIPKLITLKISVWEMMDCKHEHWGLEHCVKCSSAGGMRCCLFIPWNSFSIFRAKRRGILSQYLRWVLFLSFLEMRALELAISSFIYSCSSHWNCLAILTQSSPTKYHLPEMNQEKQQTRFGLSLWRSPAGEQLSDEGK